MSTQQDQDDQGDLFPRLAAGDRDAFNSIVQRAWKSLLGFARDRLRKTPAVQPAYDAEDAVQSGLSELWRNIIDGKVRPPDGYDMFMRLMRTIIGRRILKKAREERPPGVAPLPHDAEDWSHGPLIMLVPDKVDLFDIGVPSEEAAVIAKDEFEWLRSLLDRDHRAVIDRRLEGWTVPRIADELGVSASTVERRLRKVIYIWHEAARPHGRWPAPGAGSSGETGPATE